MLPTQGADGLAGRDDAMIEIGQRQAEQQPALRGPQLGDVLHAQVERCADYAADQTRGHGQQQLLQGHPQGGFGLAVKIIQVAHRNS